MLSNIKKKNKNVIFITKKISIKIIDLLKKIV